MEGFGGGRGGGLWSRGIGPCRTTPSTWLPSIVAGEGRNIFGISMIRKCFGSVYATGEILSRFDEIRMYSKWHAREYFLLTRHTAATMLVIFT